KDNYRLSFIGDPAALLTSLADTVADHRIHEPQETPDGLTINAEFTLRPGTDMRRFISAANEAVEIVTFDRALPSMNEIFIKAVEKANTENAG
ncbi:MAG: DUF4162 domain-containing protein, partial [Muribaculaceae bacterium]|nr:DUF4162 domain-containing protein [Muribaculaceae bacterium]